MGFASYRALGIRTVPLAGKVPLVGWKHVSLDDKWEDEFPNANIGAIGGEVVTVVDVDSDALLEWARATFGETPLEVRSPRGFHLWYRASGEPRIIRWNGMKIDILGAGGYVVVPPSKGYEFIKGSLADVPNLPTIREGVIGPVSASVEFSGEEGSGRNKYLFGISRTLARSIDDSAELLRLLLEHNAALDTPLAESEVANIVKSTWKYKTSNRLITKERPGVVIFNDELDTLRAYPSGSDALLLLADLRRNHGWRRGEDREFALANAAARRYGMTYPRFTNAWRVLAETGLIVVEHTGGLGKHDPRRVRLAS